MSTPSFRAVRHAGVKLTASIMAATIGWVLAAIMLPGPAGAEIDPTAVPTWGLSGQMPSPANNFNGEVWAMTQIGDVMYVGGKFTEAVSGPGGRTVPRVALAAFDAHTGQLIESFAPDVRGGAVYNLVASPDGSRLFVAGQFTSVEGQPATSGLAALNPVTGALDPTWNTHIDRPWADQDAVGRSLAIHGDWLYIGGNFSHIEGAGQRIRVFRVGRISLSTGRPDTSFAPEVAGGGVWDIEPSVDGSRLYIAGMFSTVNGNATYGDRFASVDTVDGSLTAGVQPFLPNLDSTGQQYSIVATENRVFVGGEEHMMQVLDATTLARVQVYFTGSPSFVNSWPLFGGGDFQKIVRVGDRVYASCHCWSYILKPNTGGMLFHTLSPPPGQWTPIRSVAAFDAQTGDYIPSFRLNMSGRGGVWAMHGASDGCLWVGGDFSQSGDQWIKGQARFCDESMVIDTERPSTPRGLIGEADAEGIALRWTGSTDNVGVIGYQIHRSTDGTLGEIIATVPELWFTDTTGDPDVEYTYGITAIDAANNQSWRSNFVTMTAAAAPDTIRPTPPTGLRAVSAPGAGVTLNWNPSTDNVGVTGYTIYRADTEVLGPLLATITGPDTSFVDDTALPGSTVYYTVKAIDAAGNESWRSNFAVATADSEAADTERPSTPTGLRVSASDGSISLNWNPSTDNVAVTGYQIFRSTDGTVGPLHATVTDIAFVDEDLPPGQSWTYTVKAIDAAGNVSWRSNLATASS